MVWGGSHLPGFSRPCRGILGREGSLDDDLSRQGTAALCLGSQAAGLACSSLGYWEVGFHAPQAAPVWLCSYRHCSRQENDSVAGNLASERARREARAKSKQRGGEREAEKSRRNRRARPNLAPPMGSVAARRQVITSKLGPCSPRLVGGGKGRGSPGSYTDVLGGSSCSFCHLSPILPGQDAS